MEVSDNSSALFCFPAGGSEERRILERLRVPGMYFVDTLSSSSSSACAPVACILVPVLRCAGPPFLSTAHAPCGVMRHDVVWGGSQEARLERAEGVEVRRQLREALAELESDRSSQARRARSNMQVWRAVAPTVVDKSGSCGGGSGAAVGVSGGFCVLFTEQLPICLARDPGGSNERKM